MTTPIEVIKILEDVRDSYRDTNPDLYREYDKLIDRLEKM